MKNAWIITAMVVIALILTFKDYKPKKPKPDPMFRKVEKYCDKSNFGRIEFKWKVRDIELKPKPQPLEEM